MICLRHANIWRLVSGCTLFDFMISRQHIFVKPCTCGPATVTLHPMSHVLGFLFDPRHTHVVLIQKNRPEWQRGKFNGVGGRIETGETPVQAMVREFHEETGLHLSDWQHFATLQGSTFQVECFFAVSQQMHTVQTCEDEPVSIHSVRDLPEQVHFNLRYLIPMALDPQLRKPVVLQHHP